MSNFFSLVDNIRGSVRSVMHFGARAINKLSGGKIHPNTVTMAGVLGHILIAFTIGSRHYVLAAVLLVVFGLFDTLDGELARLQNRVSKVGMLLDSVMDRLKEILLYIGVAYAFVATNQPSWAVWAVAACGFSLLVSYMNAWGEVVAGDKVKNHEVNRSFRGGFMTYEIRMSVLVLALLINQLDLALIVIAVAAWWTAMNRLLTIINKLES